MSLRTSKLVPRPSRLLFHNLPSHKSLAVSTAPKKARGRKAAAKKEVVEPEDEGSDVEEEAPKPKKAPQRR